MVKVTFEFTSIEEAISAMRNIPESSLVGFKSTPEKSAPEKAAPKPAPTPAAPETATPAPAAPAPAEPAAASPSSPKAAKATAQAAKPAPAASSDVPYATLKTAVLVLVGKSHEAAVALAKEMGIPNFKVYEAEERAGDRANALAAVNAKIASL